MGGYVIQRKDGMPNLGVTDWILSPLWCMDMSRKAKERRKEMAREKEDAPKLLPPPCEPPKVKDKRAVTGFNDFVENF